MDSQGRKGDTDYVPRGIRRVPPVPSFFTDSYALSLADGWKDKPIRSSVIQGSALIYKTGYYQLMIFLFNGKPSKTPSVAEVLAASFVHVARAIIVWPPGDGEPSCTIKASGE